MITYSLVDNIRWEFREASTLRWREASVPGCVHRDLLRHKLIPDPFWARNEHDVQWVSDRTWVYRAEFTVAPELLAQEEIDLVAEGLDTLVTVRVNGRVVGHNENMFVGRRFSVGGQLRPGRNVLEFQFDSATRYIAQHRQKHLPREVNDPVGGCTRIRKQQCQFGWDWAPRLVTAGIWRDLRLEGWSVNRLVDVRIAQRHAADGSVTLELTPELLRPERATREQWKFSVTNGMASEAAWREGEGRRIVLTDPQRWWPRGHGEQPLYVIEVAVFGARWPGDRPLLAPDRAPHVGAEEKTRSVGRVVPVCREWTVGVRKRRQLDSGAQLRGGAGPGGLRAVAALRG